MNISISKCNRHFNIKVSTPKSKLRSPPYSHSNYVNVSVLLFQLTGSFSFRFQPLLTSSSATCYLLLWSSHNHCSCGSLQWPLHCSPCLCPGLANTLFPTQQPDCFFLNHRQVMLFLYFKPSVGSAFTQSSIQVHRLLTRSHMLWPLLLVWLHFLLLPTQTSLLASL